MAAKKALEVVPSLPKQDLEELLSVRLAREITEDLDMGKLAKLTIAKVAVNLKAKFIDWLSTNDTSRFALNEVEAIATSSEEVAA
jgi:hypothetical protein